MVPGRIFLGGLHRRVNIYTIVPTIFTLLACYGQPILVPQYCSAQKSVRTTNNNDAMIFFFLLFLLTAVYTTLPTTYKINNLHDFCLFSDQKFFTCVNLLYYPQKIRPINPPIYTAKQTQKRPVSIPILLLWISHPCKPDYDLYTLRITTTFTPQSKPHHLHHKVNPIIYTSL